MKRLQPLNRIILHLLPVLLLSVNIKSFGQNIAIPSSVFEFVFENMLQYYTCDTYFYGKIIENENSKDVYISMMFFGSIIEIPDGKSYYIYRKNKQTIILEKSATISLDICKDSKLIFCPNIISLRSQMQNYPEFFYTGYGGILYFPELWRYKISLNNHFKIKRKVALNIFHPLNLCDTIYWPLNKTLRYASKQYTDENPLHCLTKTIETIQKEKPVLILKRK